MGDHEDRKAPPKTPLLRHEAESRSRFQLATTQTDALKQIAAMLREALGYVDYADALRSNPQRPEVNLSRLCFLSGARGTGKTTVLYSLLDGLDELAGRRIRTHSESSGDPLACLQSDADRIIVLETLDMEPLGEPANLLAAILARVEAVAEYPADEWERTSLDRGPSPYARAFDELSRLQTDATLSWASDLPERGQRGDPETLAAETRRVEFARLKLVRRVEEMLKLLSDGVGRRNSGLPSLATSGRGYIYLLPVDDFDLNPVRCLEMLKLLRMLSVPRLFTVVVGHVDTAEMLFGLKVFRDLSSIAGLHTTTAPDSPEIRLLTLAQSLAADALRKLVPPSQVVRLRAMRVTEALGFRPNAGSRTLREQLQRFKLEPMRMAEDAVWRSASERVPYLAGVPLSSLESLVTVTQAAFEVSRWSDGDEYAYPGAALLHAPPRHIVDMWMALERIVSEIVAPAGVATLSETGAPAGAAHPVPSYDDRTTQAPNVGIEKFLAFLARNYERAVKEDPTFLTRERETLLKAVQRDFRGRWQLQTDLIMPVHYAPGPEITLQRALAPALRATLGDGAAMPPETARVSAAIGMEARHCIVGGEIVRRWNDWDLLPNTAQTVGLLQPRRRKSPNPSIDWPSPPRHSRMTDSLQATIMLFHDLVVFTGAGGLVGRPLVPCLGVPCAETWFEVEPGDFTVTVPWPLPNWQTFWELSLMRNAWNAAWRDADDARDAAHDAARKNLVFRWLAACTAIVFGSMTPLEETTRELLDAAIGRTHSQHVRLRSSPSSDQWRHLGLALTRIGGDLEQLDARHFPRQQRLAGWLWSVVAIVVLTDLESVLTATESAAFDELRARVKPSMAGGPKAAWTWPVSYWDSVEMRASHRSFRSYGSKRAEQLVLKACQTFVRKALGDKTADWFAKAR